VITLLLRFPKKLQRVCIASLTLSNFSSIGAAKEGFAGKGVIQSRGYISVFRRETVGAKSA
jgi:hypothetical protein